MTEPLPFPDLVQLVDDRSAALRAAVAAARDLATQVPTCPEWSLRDLVEHLGGAHRRWAATLAAGPAASPADPSTWESAAPTSAEDLVGWSAASTELLLDALRTSGPDRGCWTWWDGSQSPSTSGAVARHQAQHVTVHAYDAQATVGSPQPLPAAAAADGVDEFLRTCVATTSAWPHGECRVDYVATDAEAHWRLALSGTGARVAPAGAGPADAVLRGTSSDLVLALYGRKPVDALGVEGDRRLFDQLLAWDADA